MLLILIRILSGTFLWRVCECSLFIAMQYRKLERERESEREREREIWGLSDAIDETNGHSYYRPASQRRKLI